MKQFITLSFLFLLVLPITLSAQWTAQSSGTSQTLQDIYFLNEDYGAAVGDSSTILLTTNGGTSWQPLTIATKNSIQSVLILGVDTLLVASGTYFDGDVYLTTDGGTNWEPVAKGIDLAQSGDFIFTLNSKNILRTDDPKEKWDSTDILIGNTTLLEHLHFPKGRVGYAIGNISGFSTYSTYLYRSVDDGQNWTSVFLLDFPNSNAYTAASFPNADYGFIFTNRNERFLPGRLNQLFKVSDFYFDSIQTQAWRFASEIVNDSLPTYINDAHFFDAMNGYAVGENGNIYKTSNGGVDWTSDYTGEDPLKALFMLNEKYGFAVGENGTILKFSRTTSIPRPSQTLDLQFYPNPTSGDIHLQGLDTNDALLTILNSTGQILQQTALNGKQAISLNHLANGWYLLQVKSGNLIYNGKLILNK